MEKKITTVREPARDIPVRASADILIVGGGPAGLMAAQAAAGEGLKVMLVESRGYLGGNLTIGLPILGFLGQKGNQIIEGLPQRFIDRLQERGAASGHRPCKLHVSLTIIDPEESKTLAQQLMEEAGVEVLMYVFCTDVIREGNEVKGVVIESKAGREAILARTVIDCTGDADVAFRAGVECRKGDAEGGMQPPTLMFSMRGVATQRLRDAIAEHPDIYDIDIMPAESFRNEKFITVGLRNQIAKAREAGIDLPVARTILITGMSEDEIWVNMSRVNGVDPTDPGSYTRGEIEARKQVYRIRKYLRQFVPGFENAWMDRVAPFMGIRESRVIVGRYVLTAEDIAGAKGVIIAADKNIELSRFDGKPLFSCPVSRGINEPEVLINEVMEGRAPIHHNAGGAAAPAATSDGESTWHKIYKRLMNGVSHMLPFVIGGGILTAIAFLVDQPGLGTSAYGSSIPAAALFKTIGGEAFGLMLPILAGYIASSIADRPGLAPGFVGGLFAKAGYDFAYLGTLDATTLVSGGFIAALFAGFAAGYLTLGIERACDKLPSLLEGIKPMLIYPVLGTLAIGVVMLALNPVFAAINTALNGFLAGLGTSNIVVLGLVLGGMMSVDMGGPFNKAAYVFGTAALASGNYEVMAAVMVGGMVPPIAIALSTTFCPKKWTPDERRNGIVNYVMGLCFVTEGAIPYAAADPLRVLPSCVAGAALAGALSMTFGCALRAPHGGIFVFPVVDHALLYCVALAAGSVVGAVILSLLKKNRTDAA